MLAAELGAAPGAAVRLISTTGVCEAPAGGWSPADALALFATLWASVSLSLRRGLKERR